MTLSLVEVALLVWGLAWMTLATWVALLRYSPPAVEPSPGSAVGLFEGGRPLPYNLPRFVRMPRQAHTGLASESWGAWSAENALAGPLGATSAGSR